MTLNAYLFQSPYSQPFQIGRPDPAIQKERSEETRAQQEQLQTQTVQLDRQQTAYEKGDMAVRSAVGYASSEGFSLSSEQVRRLSDASFSAKRNDYVSLYSQNG